MYSNIFFDPPDYEMVCFELNDMLEAVWTYTEFKAWIFLLFFGWIDLGKWKDVERNASDLKKICGGWRRLGSEPSLKDCKVWGGNLWGLFVLNDF